MKIDALKALKINGLARRCASDSRKLGQKPPDFSTLLRKTADNYIVYIYTPSDSAISAAPQGPIVLQKAATSRENSNMPDFGENLKRLMARLDLTVEQVTDRCDLDDRTVKSLLHGRHKPHPRTLHRLAEGLGVSCDELFQNPALLAWRSDEFDRATNPAVDALIASEPDLFAEWSLAEFRELSSRFGEGGQLTEEGTRQTVERMNRRRDVQRKVALLLETDQAELLLGLLDLLCQKSLATAKNGECATGFAGAENR